MPISTRVSRLLAAIAALIAGVVPNAVAPETKGAPRVQREVFAEQPTINVVNTIMRVKRDGLDGVLIVGSGNASMSCFVPDGGTASCAALKLTSVDAAQLVGSHDGDATSLLVHGLWGEPALALLGRNGEVVWRYDAKFTAMGHFAVLAREGGTEAVIAERNKGLLFFDAITGKVRSTVQLTGQLTDVFRISGSDGHRYLMGLSGAGHVLVLTTAGELVRVTPNIGVFHAATSQGDNPVLFIAPWHSSSGIADAPGATRSRGKRTPRQALDKTMALGARTPEQFFERRGAASEREYGCKYGRTKNRGIRGRI